MNEYNEVNHVNLKGKKLGFALTGSHCTFTDVIPQLKNLVEKGAEIYPIASFPVLNTDTRFGAATDWQTQVEEITGKKIISTIVEAEKFGPKIQLDAMIIAPMTGNTMSKLANAVTDSPVLMATKATMRNLKPIILAVSTNDALGLNGKNLMQLVATKNIYFVPFGQDDPIKKPNSLIAKLDLLADTVREALNGKQLQPLLITFK